MAVTLERLSLAEGIVLARTWSPAVRRQPECKVAAVAGGGTVLAAASDEFASMPMPTPAASTPVVDDEDDDNGTIMKPWGRRAMEEGSSPLMAS